MPWSPGCPEPGSIAVHATGHQLHEIVGALHAARVPADIVVVGRGVDERTLVDLGAAGPVYAASAWHRTDVPDLVVTLERGTGERADAVTALGYDVAGLLVDAARHDGDLCATDQDGGLVVRRAASGRSRVVARRAAPVDAPDLAAAELDPLRRPALAPPDRARRAFAERAAARPSLSAMTSLDGRAGSSPVPR